MKNFCLEMLSNECFQGTRNAEPALSCCLVPGKPHPPGSWPAHGQPAGDPGPCPVPPPARRVQVSWDAPGDRAVRSHSHRLCLRALDPSAPLLPGRGASGVCSAPGDLSEQGLLALAGQHLLLLLPRQSRQPGCTGTRNRKTASQVLGPARPAAMPGPAGPSRAPLHTSSQPRTHPAPGGPSPAGSRLPSPQRLFV